MKVLAELKYLKRAVVLCEHGHTNSSASAIDAIFFEASGKTLRVSSITTYMDAVELSVTIPASVKEEGRCAINRKKFADFLKKSTGNPDVVIEAFPTKESADITIDSSKLCVNMGLTDFELLDAFREKFSFEPQEFRGVLDLRKTKILCSGIPKNTKSSLSYVIQAECGKLLYAEDIACRVVDAFIGEGTHKILTKALWLAVKAEGDCLELTTDSAGNGILYNADHTFSTAFYAPNTDAPDFVPIIVQLKDTDPAVTMKTADIRTALNQLKPFTAKKGAGDIILRVNDGIAVWLTYECKYNDNEYADAAAAEYFHNCEHTMPMQFCFDFKQLKKAIDKETAEAIQIFDHAEVIRIKGGDLSTVVAKYTTLPRWSEQASCIPASCREFQTARAGK